MDIWDLLLWTIGLVALLALYGYWEDGFFRRRGVKSLPAKFPFVGHMKGAITQTEHAIEMSQKSYKGFPEERYVGVRQFTRPIIMITDLELIKRVTIKDFDHFTDHLGIVNEETDPLFGKNLFALQGQKWRDMRATLSPAFTSAKMRAMFDFVAECGEQMADFYMKEMTKSENIVRKRVEVEMKDAFTRYTNDVIATTAFGLKVNSLEEKDNEFYVMGKQATDFSGIQLVKFFIGQVCPKLLQILGIKFFSESVANYFRYLVIDTMKQREAHDIVRPDMIQLLMDARKGELKHDHVEGNKEMKEAGFATVEESNLGKETVKRKWTDDDITAQAVLFFIAGFETASTLLCFMAHELTIHPEIQRRLQEEIDEVAAKNNGKVTYNDLLNMQYMDMVVSETLRLWPPAIATDRKCVKPYSLPPPNDKSDRSYNLKVGDGIWIPVYGIHHDPKYYKDPEVFDPERFSDENKENIQQFSYLPFGIGPRNCIGSRFALMEAKAVIFHLLLKFDMNPTTKTQNPIRLNKNTFNLHAERGFWIGLKPRNASII